MPSPNTSRPSSLRLEMDVNLIDLEKELTTIDLKDENERASIRAPSPSVARLPNLPSGRRTSNHRLSFLRPASSSTHNFPDVGLLAQLGFTEQEWIRIFEEDLRCDSNGGRPVRCADDVLARYGTDVVVGLDNAGGVGDHTNLKYVCDSLDRKKKEREAARDCARSAAAVVVLKASSAGSWRSGSSGGMTPMMPGEFDRMVRSARRRSIWMILSMTILLLLVLIVAVSLLALSRPGSSNNGPSTEPEPIITSTIAATFVATSAPTLRTTTAVFATGTGADF
ncbi:hypothetical protein HK101_010019 [Irineochytrium annulatum]|nr:hypothetical protein HK101_010019 [Irineochytrium annulatum]